MKVLVVIETIFAPPVTQPCLKSTNSAPDARKLFYLKTSLRWKFVHKKSTCGKAQPLAVSI
jgi:hypothetical protein